METNQKQHKKKKKLKNGYLAIIMKNIHLLTKIINITLYKFVVWTH